MGSGDLHKYFLNNNNRRLHKWFHYFDIYEKHFSRFRNLKPVILEIGVMGGGSLEMWQDYFGEGAQIIGLDIDPKCKSYEREGIEIFIGSQDDPEVLNAIKQKYPSFDIVIDDGSHYSPHMLASFVMLYESVSKNGVYFVEDTHTNYWPEYGGGVQMPGTFVEFAKQKIDELNAVHTRGVIQPSVITVSTNSMCFYDSVIVFEKRMQGFRQDAITNGILFPNDR